MRGSRRTRRVPHATPHRGGERSGDVPGRERRPQRIAKYQLEAFPHRLRRDQFAQHGVVRQHDAGIYRFDPRSHKLETYVSYNFANPWGHVFDRWGQDIVVDGTGSNPYHAALFSGHVEYPNKHGRPPQVYQQWTRPCSGMEILSSKHFPDAVQGNLLVLNVIGYQGILMYKLRDQGASIVGTEDTRLLSSSDPNFRPADIKMGPDGAMYFCDWHNPMRWSISGG